VIQITILVDEVFPLRLGSLLGASLISDDPSQTTSTHQLVELAFGSEAAHQGDPKIYN
jgi:hypothetical protein